ncbi:MAG: phosphotransferase [Bacteroidales bacterium]|nr:phosphotransferase [Bacteroidales bacterium]
MEPRPIDLNDNILSGGGFMGESYNCKDNPDYMLKLYPLGRTTLAQKEYERSKEAYTLGIHTPVPKELVKAPDGRMGIVFRRIQGKKSFAKAVGEDPSRTEELAARFAAMCKTLHSTRVNKEEVSSIKEFFGNAFQPVRYLTSAQNDKLLRFIADIPDADTAVHGDLHFGNAILRGNESWFIDIGEFGYGNPLFDLGIFMSVTKYTAEDMIRKLYHMDKGTAVRFWEAFLREYYGADRPLKDLEEEIKPYAALRALFVQHEIGRLPPERQELVKCIIG